MGARDEARERFRGTKQRARRLPRALYAGLELPMKASRAAEGREEAEAGPLAHTLDDADTAERERRIGARRRWRGEARLAQRRCGWVRSPRGRRGRVHAGAASASERDADRRPAVRADCTRPNGRQDGRTREGERTFPGPAQRARDAQATAARGSESSGGGDGEKCALQRAAGCRSGSTGDGDDGGAAWEEGPRGWW
jgi:hypothetical protein